MSKGIDIKLDKNMANSIIQALREQFSDNLPFNPHCPICGKKLPKELNKYKQNIYHPNEYTYRCECGAYLYFYLDDYTDYNQKYIDIGINWAKTEVPE
jgi:lysyl-tRNA synthetase class I